MDKKLLEEIFKGVKVRVGLKQQGHMQTVKLMLLDGKSWDEIGFTIGWSGKAVKEWYEMENEECSQSEK